MDVPLRPSIVSKAPLSPSGSEFISGRHQGIEAMEQRFPNGDGGHPTSAPPNTNGRNHHEGGYTAPAPNSPAARHHNIEPAYFSSSPSRARFSLFTTPARPPASIGEDLHHENGLQGHVQRPASTGPPANAPKGPSGRQQQPRYSVTGQNGPPPNAPTGPAAMRKQHQQRKQWQPQQEPTYPTEGKASYSITWKSELQQLREGSNTYRNQMDIMGVNNEARATNIAEYISLRTGQSNRKLHLVHIKNATENATREARETNGYTKMALGENIRQLREKKLTRRDLFTPFYVEMWWDRAVPAVGGNIWPSVPDQKKAGDGNKSCSSPRSLCPPSENQADKEKGIENKKDGPANYFIRPAQTAISAEGSMVMPTDDLELNRESWYPRELIEFIDEDTNRKIQEELDEKKEQPQERENESNEEAWRRFMIE